MEWGAELQHSCNCRALTSTHSFRRPLSHEREGGGIFGKRDGWERRLKWQKGLELGRGRRKTPSSSSFVADSQRGVSTGRGRKNGLVSKYV